MARSPSTPAGRRERKAPPPLDADKMRETALRYVERFATTRGRLVQYLDRKLRERGWAGDEPPDPRALAERFAELGYVDDRVFAEARASAMARRGLGARRVRDAWARDGVGADDTDALAPTVDARAAEAALAYARRKRFGPWAPPAPDGVPADRDVLARQLASMGRAGHSYSLARRVLEMPPGTEPDPADLV